MICTLTTPSFARAPSSRVAVESCNGNGNYITNVSGVQKELYSHTGKYIDAGNSKSFTFGSSYSVSNSSSFAILPELVNMGFSREVSISANETDTINNTSSYPREVGVYRMYKTVTYTGYYYIGNGLCEVRPNLKVKVYTGWMLGLI